jgi:N-acetyltransferase
MPPAVTLRGSRVRLEPLTLGHVDALVQAATESRDTYGFTLVPADRRAMADYVQAALEDQGIGWALPFAIYDLHSQVVVGTTRFLDLDYWTWPPAWPPGRAMPRADAIPTVAEIGSTWLAPSAQRSGCNTESKLLMLSHAFDTWGVLRVTLKTDSRNARSRRAIERIGGRFEGIRRAHARAVDGSVRDTAYYSIVSHEWPDVCAALKARLNALSRVARHYQANLGHDRSGHPSARIAAVRRVDQISDADVSLRGCRDYWLRREISSDSAMWSASTARSPCPRRSRACRSSLRELLEGFCGAVRSGSAPCSSMR